MSLLSTVALRDRVGGAGEVAGEITVSEISAIALVASSSVGNMHMTS